MTVNRKDYKSKRAPKGANHVQIWFEQEQALFIEKTINEENDGYGMVGKDDKYKKYQIIPMLIDNARDYREYKVYVPDYNKAKLMKDDKFSKAYAKAVIANEELKKIVAELK